MRFLTTLAAAVAVFGLAGCNGDSTGGGPVDPTDFITFDFSGSMSGHFDANGLPAPRSGSYSTHSFAAAFRQGSDLIVIAYDSVAAGRGDYVIAFLDTTTVPKTYSLAGFQCENEGSCAQVGLYVNGDINSQTDVGEYLEANTGSLQVTAASATRIQGTFSGTGVSPAVSFTNGRFSLPVSSQFVLYDRIPAALREPVRAAIERRLSER
jgi:hypothetical protein